MPNNIPNSTSYEHSNEPNLVNLHKAMEYDVNGNPVIRTVAATSVISTPATTTTAFGEQVVAQLSPAFQLDGLYGLDLNNFQLNSSLSGTQSVDDFGLMTVSSGTTPGSFSTLRSKRSVRYRPGQGSVCRFTAMYPNGQVNGYQQVAGFINQSDVLGVGYNVNNSEFGVLRRQNSKGEVAKFQLTSAATGAETVTLTLNDVEFTVSVTAGTIQHNTAELGNATYTQWVVDYCNDVITFLYNGPPSDLTGTFSISSTGTLAATYTKLQDGAAPNDNWTYQSNFNLDKLDGTGPSGITIDFTKLNVFQIDFRWLGAGRIRYSIEDSTTGNMIPFHIEHYSSQNTQPSIANPSMRVGYAVVNAAPGLGTGLDVQVKGASMMGAIEGQVIRNNTTKAVQTVASATLSAGSEHHVLSVKNNRFNPQGKPSVVNQREIIITSLSVAAVGTGTASDPIEILLYKNADLSTNREYNVLDSSTDYSDTIATVTAGQNDKIVGAFSVSPESNLVIDLQALRIILAPLDVLSIALLSTNTIQERAVSLNFVIE